MKEVSYLANDYEDAVIRVTGKGRRFVKFYNAETKTLEDEFLAHKESKVAYGDIGNDLLEISEEDYNTFGKTWHFDGRNWCVRTNIE